MKTFWDQVKKGKGCWEWTGNKSYQGYGEFFFCGRRFPAHRASYQINVGRVDGGLLVCHKCDNKSCVRPSHLFLGTAKDNSRDMIKKGRGKNQFKPGEKHWKAKLTDKQVLKIKKLASQKKMPHGEIGRLFNVHQSCISRIANGKRRCTNTPMISEA